VRYLLDTNACVALINQKPARVRLRFDRARDRGGEMLVSCIAACELWYGVAKSPRQEANARRVETFFAGPLAVLPFDEEDARSAGRIRATLESAGKPMGGYDLLIAGQAIRHKLTLITANTREFGRVSGLTWEDWSKS
jgi:tRNA(fMet)-specific endonuclease VapC